MRKLTALIQNKPRKAEKLDCSVRKLLLSIYVNKQHF